jgi:hypothetical protein
MDREDKAIDTPAQIQPGKPEQAQALSVTPGGPKICTGQVGVSALQF